MLQKTSSESQSYVAQPLKLRGAAPQVSITRVQVCDFLHIATLLPLSERDILISRQRYNFFHLLCF